MHSVQQQHSTSGSSPRQSDDNDDAPDGFDSHSKRFSLQVSSSTSPVIGFPPQNIEFTEPVISVLAMSKRLNFVNDVNSDGIVPDNHVSERNTESRSVIRPKLVGIVPPRSGFADKSNVIIDVQFPSSFGIVPLNPEAPMPRFVNLEKYPISVSILQLSNSLPPMDRSSNVSDNSRKCSIGTDPFKELYEIPNFFKVSES